MPNTCPPAVLYQALAELLSLARHYASQLNQYDGGARRLAVFASPEAWIARLRKTGALPAKDKPPRPKEKPPTQDALPGKIPFQPHLAPRGFLAVRQKEAVGCDGCHFLKRPSHPGGRNSCCSHFVAARSCLSIYRPDHTSVIFVKEAPAKGRISERRFITHRIVNRRKGKA